MSCKTFVWSAFGLTTLLIAAYLSLCCAIDPFNLYHPISSLRYISTEQRLARPAVARSPNYDSYFVGSSMIQEFVPADFNKALGARFAHLTLSAASSYEDLNLLKLLAPRRYKYLVMEVYFQSFTPNLHATYYPDYPAYLYDDNPYNDIEAYLTCNPFMLGELYRAYFRNFRGIDKDPHGYRPTPDGYYSWESQKRWDAQSVRAEIASIWQYRHGKTQFSTENFRAILETAAPRFEHVLLYFPPVHAEALRVHFIAGPPENMTNYLAWKKDAIAMASAYPQVVFIDYQTINPYTLRDENYFDFNHYRANLRQMILDDFASWLKRHRLAHGDFGQLADRAYGQRLSPQSLFFPEGSRRADAAEVSN